MIDQRVKKVIYLMVTSSREEEFTNQPQPEFNWQTASGATVGIWGLEWGDLIMKALADAYPKYNCEVWQPDLRADKPYEANLRGNLKHINYPAVTREKGFGWSKRRDIWSDSYGRRLRECDAEDTLFLAPVGAHRLWLRPLIRSVERAKILYLTLLNSKLILPDTKYPANPLKALKLLMINHVKRESMRRVRDFLVQNDNPRALARIRQVYPHIRIHNFQMGQDLDFWRRTASKAQVRQKIGLTDQLFVIVMSQRLVPEYQVDKFLEVLASIETGREVKCYITGHGTSAYESQLKVLASKFGLADKVEFVGFVTDEELRNYFIAADLFVTLPKLFAGSGGALKCMALGTPILHVTEGCTYELLRDNNAGEFLGPTDYAGWAVKLREIINGRDVKVIPRDVVERILSWGKTARDINEAIETL